jgi:transglutaminase-like putative cysteine protease
VKLSVRHRTAFTYSDEIADTAMEMRLRPLDDARQRLLSYDLRVEPRGAVHAYRDGFGNLVETYNHRPPHRRVVVEARSVVETRPGQSGGEEPSGAERFRLLRHDGPVADVPWVREQAACFEGRAHEPAMLADLTSLVHRAFVYEPNVTRVDSTVADLVELGRGVCQDFAHVWIALCRRLGVPARYVSGYLFTGDARQPQASHAWGEAWLPGHGWLAHDPTNPDGGVDQSYVRVALGRDYRDVPPTRGVFRGAASETLEVDVRVDLLGTPTVVPS